MQLQKNVGFKDCTICLWCLGCLDVSHCIVNQPFHINYVQLSAELISLITRKNV